MKAAGLPRTLTSEDADSPQVTTRRSGWWPGSPASHRPVQAAAVHPPGAQADGFRPAALATVGTADDLTFGALFAGADLPSLAIVDPGRIPSLTVSLLTSQEELDEIVALRRTVYSRHQRPMRIDREALDVAPHSAVLGVRDPAGLLFASIRVSFSEDGGQAWLNRYRLPDPYRGARLASFERLAIDKGGLRAVRAKQLLFKAAYLLAIGSMADWIVISTVAPLNRLFESLGFTSIFADGEPIQLDWFGDPQHVLAMPADDNGIALLKSNRQWYDLIVTPDNRLEAVLAAYFARIEGRADVTGFVPVERRRLARL